MAQDKEWAFRIAHMIGAIEEILEYTKAHSAETFMSDKQTVRSVERCFEILGEAARKIPSEIQNQNTQIPWKRITGLRNILAHDYDKSRDMILWVTIERDLKPLLDILRAMEKE